METREGKKTGDTMGDLGYGHDPKGEHAEKKRKEKRDQQLTDGDSRSRSRSIDGRLVTDGADDG